MQIKAGKPGTERRDYDSLCTGVESKFKLHAITYTRAGKIHPDEDEPTSNLEMKKSSFVGGWGCDKTNKNENMYKVLGQKIKPTPSRVKVKRLT